MQSEGCNGLLRVVYSREDESHLKSKEKEWVAIMEWMYRSTRNAANRVTASQAILQGLAEDRESSTGTCRDEEAGTFPDDYYGSDINQLSCSAL